MKNLIYIFALSILVVSCKKQSNDPAPQNSTNNSTPTPTATAWTKPSTFFDTKVVRTFCSIGTTLFVGTDNGRVKSIDNGNTWQSINTGLPDSNLTYMWTDGASLYTKIDGVSGVSSAKIYKSTNSGTSWSLMCNTGGLTSIRSLAFIGTKIIAASSNNIYTSSDNGTTWSQAYSGTFVSTISSFVSNGSNVYSTNGGNPIKSTDGGLSFSDITATTSSITLSSNVVLNGTNLFVADNAGGHGVFKSIDNGSTWSTVNTGIVGVTTPLTIRTLYSSSSNIYAGTINRVFKSSNLGTNWSQLGADYPSSSGSNQIFTNFLLNIGGFTYSMTSKGLFKIAD